MTDVSQSIISRKQDLVYGILGKYLGVYCVISVLIIILGLSILIIGLVQWYKKAQKSIDQKQVLENEKLMSEIKLTKEEKVSKIKKDIEEDNKY